MHEKITPFIPLYLEVPDLQEEILKKSASPATFVEIVCGLLEKDFETDLLAENVLALLRRGELAFHTPNTLLAAGENPHQLTLPDFDDFQKTA